MCSFCVARKNILSECTCIIHTEIPHRDSLVPFALKTRFPRARRRVRSSLKTVLLSWQEFIQSVSQSVSLSAGHSIDRYYLSIYYVPGIFWNHLDFLSLVISLSRREPLPRQDSGPYGDHFSLVQLTRWKWLYFHSLAQDWLSRLAPWLPEELKPNYFFLTRPIFSLVSMTCPGPGLVWNADASVLAHRKYLTNCSVDYGYTYSVSLVWVTKLYQRL